MSESHRIKRVEREIQEIVATYIQRSMQFPTLVSVVRSEVSKDIQHAKIFVSVFGEDQDQAERCMEIIEDFRADIQKHLGKSLSTRYTPKLKFYLDHGFNNMSFVNEVLKNEGPQNNE